MNRIKIFCLILIVFVISSCQKDDEPLILNQKDEITVSIDLNNIIDDKVVVTLSAPIITTDQIIYSFPKSVPGMYSVDNYGQFISNFQAFNSRGVPLKVQKLDKNSWLIMGAKALDNISYAVDDTFELENKPGQYPDEFFSPAGSNIDAGTNFLINPHSFIGYFENKMQIPYVVNIKHPANLWGATSLIDLDASATSDVFNTDRYATLIDNPIMYSEPNYVSYDIDGMEVTVAIYSPTGKYIASDLTTELEAVFTAQKQYLGSLALPKKYTVLLYLSKSTLSDASKYGALEHPTATTVVFPERYDRDKLAAELNDIVAHEFFHIVTPLAIHSNEIHNFDYNNPKMSAHLWMYEGVTSYFQYLFRVNQNLDEAAVFINSIKNLIKTAKYYGDVYPMTMIGKNILVSPYNAQFPNVYYKGALIAMCLDIIIREKSNGRKGILNLMEKLSHKYGPNKAFDDEDLFDDLLELTYPEVGVFLLNYVGGNTPIPYEFYLLKMGIDINQGTNPIIEDDEEKMILRNKWLKG